MVVRHKRQKPYRPSGIYTTLNVSDYPQLRQSYEIDPELTRLTYKFLTEDEHAYRSIGSCTTSATAYGKCYDVSYELMKYLRRHGHLKAQILSGTGYRKLPDADSTWGEDDLELIKHHVVLVGDKVIDLTGAQFQKKNGWRWVYSLAQFNREWELSQIYDTEQRQYTEVLHATPAGKQTYALEQEDLKEMEEKYG